jgi:predicted MFS family arabinose efflux permease
MMIACICAVLTVNSIEAQLVLLLLFSFVWMFVPPFQLPFLLGIDHTARTAMYIGSSQLVGIAVGPLLASTAVEGESVAGTLGVTMFCLAAAAVLPLAARRLSKR